MINPLGATNFNLGYFHCTLWRICRLSTVSLFFFLFSSIKRFIKHSHTTYFSLSEQRLVISHSDTRINTINMQNKTRLQSWWGVTCASWTDCSFCVLSSVWASGFMMIFLVSLHWSANTSFMFISISTYSWLKTGHCDIYWIQLYQGETKVSSFFKRYLFCSFMDTF